MSTTTTTLYDRLGRREGIARITHTLIDNHLASPVVGVRFRAADHDKLERLAIEFFCAGSGGPEAYTGRDMLATHQGMNVSEQEFVAVIDDAMAALESHGIEPGTRNEVLGVLWSLKGQVLRA